MVIVQINDCFFFDFIWFVNECCVVQISLKCEQIITCAKYLQNIDLKELTS